MSTRGLLGFRKNDTDKLMYNHSDSYPDALGLHVLNELRNFTDWSALPERIDQLKGVPENYSLGDQFQQAKSYLRRAFPDIEQAGNLYTMYDLYRPFQGSLKPYLDGKLSIMPDASEFIENSLHCEWAYIANLDSGNYEIWKGSQTHPTPTNRYGQTDDRMGFFPCMMVKEYKLEALPHPDHFLADYRSPNGFSYNSLRGGK